MGLELLKDFTVEKLHPIIGAKTIQLVVFRKYWICCFPSLKMTGSLIQ